MTISLCMIVKNEENTLTRCLSSVQNIADEIIIVDTGSTDGTKQAAAMYTDKIYDFKWIDDFSEARNFSYSKATKEYVLWLDADDLILPEDNLKLQELKKTLAADVDVVMMKYNIRFDQNGTPVFSYFRERLSKRNQNYVWREPVHEYLEISGNVVNADISVTHAKPYVSPVKHTTRNLQIYENLIAAGNQLSARGIYYYARELMDNERYADAAVQFNLFLESNLGWLEDNISACGELAKCYLIQGDEEKALCVMMKSFAYDTPRAELCCQIGYFFQNKKNYRLAAYWFKTALMLEKPSNSWGFFQNDCWGYVPAIECTVCYDNMGDYQKAEAFNELAAQFKPGSPSVEHNRKYFAGLTTPQKTKSEEVVSVVTAGISNHQS